MPITLHWYLPTAGDGRTVMGAGRSLGRTDRLPGDVPGDRPPSVKYLAQIAQAAEDLGFDAALTPTGTWCDDAWIVTSALTQLTERLRFLVAFRPGLQSPTWVAQAAAAFQRVSGDRLLLNVVTGGDDPEQRRFGDFLGKDERYERADEYVEILRGVWKGEPYSFTGKHIAVEDAIVLNPSKVFPEIYVGGASESALRVAARQADVYLTWGEPPPQVAGQIAKVEAYAREAGRTLRYGIRLYVVARDRAEDAWAAAEKLISDVDEAQISAAQAVLTSAVSEGQQRMVALHGGRRDALEVYPNLWAGLGLVRAGAGTALVGSYEEVADRIAEYHALGIDEFILSGYPHLEEVYEVGEGVVPRLRARGLVV